ncbi:MAG: type II toxin-antitoxin system HicB family antitoxin [Zoogloeaceae bacterium]|jgi:predicted HicB family RNase H-like nuclease|nr:type II toxin-antitoxin system HicB family antitoxin [Zoogloeaceae bacterium]
MNTLRSYKGYTGSAEFDSDGLVLRGKLLFIRDLIMYESPTAEGLQEEFEATVDDYLETCAELGREPQKPCSGQFSVRVPPELHRKALEKAAREGSSLNNVVVQAMGSYLGDLPSYAPRQARHAAQHGHKPR